MSIADCFPPWQLKNGEDQVDIRLGFVYLLASGFQNPLGKFWPGNCEDPSEVPEHISARTKHGHYELWKKSKKKQLHEKADNFQLKSSLTLK